MNWEKQHHVLKRASLEWLEKGTLAEYRRGIFRANANGNITQQ